MKKLIIIILILVKHFVLFSQNKEQAKLNLKTLTSRDFHGRGFCCNGDKKAAEFIANKMKQNGILHFDKDYYQKFIIQVNTFPYLVKVEMEGKKLELGKDYLIHPISGKLKGKYPITYFELKPKDYSNKFVVIDKKKLKDFGEKKIMAIEYLNALGAKGIIEICDNNLMQVQSQQQTKHILLQIKRESFDTTATEIYVDIKNKFYKNYETQNLIGYVQGEVDTFIVFGSHYDHLGEVGKEAVFRGANDNGSGNVLNIDLMNYYSSLTKKPHYSIAFMFFGAEEMGLLGSKYYTKNPLFPLNKIKLMINLDMVGSGNKGIAIVNGKVFNDVSKLLKQINQKYNYFDNIKLRGEAANSDHYYFYEKGVKSIFIYTEGNYKEYHNIYDTADKLPLTKYNELFKLLTAFVKLY